MVTRGEKKQAVKEIGEALKRHPVVAVATLQNLPSRHFNAMKKKLRGKAEVVVARTTLFTKAIGEARPELKGLESHFQGATALILTGLSPFKLYKLISQNKSKAPAKPGSIAPMDLIVPAGETNLPPGPVLSELKQAKIEAKIQGPKVVIVKDCLVAKKGEAIAEPVARALTKLGIEPMEIGLAVTAIWEKGTVYLPDVLAVDDAEVFKEISQAHLAALNIAVSAGFYEKEAIPLLVGKAYREAMAIAEKTKLGEQTATPTEGALAPPAPEGGQQ